MSLMQDIESVYLMRDLSIENSLKIYNGLNEQQVQTLTFFCSCSNQEMSIEYYSF